VRVGSERRATLALDRLQSPHAVLGFLQQWLQVDGARSVSGTPGVPGRPGAPRVPSVPGTPTVASRDVPAADAGDREVQP
jgi:hypothetical protein